MATPFKAGYFQTLEYPSDNTILIRDDLYGDHLVADPVLVELLKSPALLRLQGVCQHGVTGLLGITYRMTRLEHSIGAFLLVRSVGASLEEQIAALLHDISHTTLSHVIDWALTEPGEESFHETHKGRYVKTTKFPAILTKHGFCSLESLDENLFPLVEMASPHLCADRLDYALRDAVGFGIFSLQYAHKILASVKAFPDAFHPRRLLVLDSPQLALTLARAYMTVDRDVWSNQAHLDMYRRTGQVIRNVIKQGHLEEERLWKMSDEEFWGFLRVVADQQDLESINRLESEGLPSEDGLTLPQGAKVRTIDPDVYVQAIGEIRPLSKLHPPWASERRQYILDREATRA